MSRIRFAPFAEPAKPPVGRSEFDIMKLNIPTLLSILTLLMILAASQSIKAMDRPASSPYGSIDDHRDRVASLAQSSVEELRDAVHAEPDRVRPTWLEIAESFLVLGEAGDSADLERAAAILKVLIEDVPEDPAAQITTEGSVDEINLEVRDQVYPLALHYRATGEEESARRARDILVRFAEVVPEWPLWDPTGERRAQDDRQFHRQWNGRGIWGIWYHQDLERSLPLIYAYDTLAPFLSEEEAEVIRNDLFLHQAALIAQWPVAYNNMMPHRLHGMIEFGKFLPEPDLVHEAVQYYRDVHYLSYFPDGHFHELTPAYHNQISNRLKNLLPNRLSGYSDPAGYQHPETGERFDDLDLAADFTGHHDRMDSAVGKLVLPNRRYLALNDAPFDGRAWGTPDDFQMTPSLLGQAGVASLVMGEGDQQQAVFLKFAGTHGHEHYDMLGMIWWSHGREVFSETSYRPLPDSDNTREWHTMTAGHNTVVMDEISQHGRHSGYRRELSERDTQRGHRSWRWRHIAGASQNYGQLLLYDPTDPEVQAIEADGHRAYTSRADLYRRTLALVNLGEGNGYLADIFRVRGGRQHDYLLHGGLDEPYKLEFGVETEPAEGVMHKYIQLQEQVWTMPPFWFRFRYEDGLQTTSHILSPSVPDGRARKGVQVFGGKAPAMRHTGQAPFVILHRLGIAELREPGGDNFFVLVHESGFGESKVTGTEMLTFESDDPEAVAFRVQLGEREDLFFSTLDGGTITLEDGTTFQGRLGYLRRENGAPVMARLFDGTKLVDSDGRGIEDLQTPVGRVLEVLRREGGDEKDGFVVEYTGERPEEWVGRTLHLQMPEELVWSYRITGVGGVEEGRVLVEVEHEPGFELAGDGQALNMLFFPGWGMEGEVSYRIPLSASYQWSGE